MIRSHTYLAVLAVTLSALVMPASGQAADPFGNGTIKTPTTASGGTGTAVNLQTDDDSNYTVANGSTASIGGFGTHGSAITSVYLFVQYSVETGYTGTNAIRVNGVATTIVPALRDYGRWAYVDITAGSFGIDTSAEISTLSVTFHNNGGGNGKAVLFDCAYVVVNPQTAIPAPPTWSEDFNGTGQANPMVWNYEVGYQRNNEAQYYVAGASNGWQEGGNFIIEGRKEPINGYQYTSASIVTSDKYYWKFGRAQIRAKIPAKAGMWPAIWGTGEVGQWPPNGEVDIMEYYGEKILANVAVGTTQQWTAKWDSASRTLPSLLAVDSNWRNEWHIWTMQWDDLNVRLYVDNILVNTIPQSWMVNTAGYNTSWGPQYPFQSNGMSCWLNLAMGGSAGGDPTATMNSGPQRYLIDYWKIWEGATSNVAPTDIALTANSVAEGQAIGTVVGNLSATDADPAEVHRYTLVTGTGSTHNAQFSIPEFISGDTLKGVLKTAAVLNYADGPTRSIRVRATDIEGATYEKVLTINVAGGSGTLALSAATYSVTENAGPATITVTRSGGSLGAASVQYATANGTATAGSDYTAVSGTLNWADGDLSSKTFTIPITNDTALEANETVNLTLSSASGATLATPATAVLTIVDDDGQPLVLVGGNIRNGNFNNPSGGAIFTNLANWTNLGTAGQVVDATKIVEPYDATPYAELGYLAGSKIFAIDTERTLVQGDVFDVSYVWKDAWLWSDSSYRVAVSLYVTADNTITGTQTVLVTSNSNLSTLNNTYETVDQNSIYTATAGVVGKRLFVKIYTTNTTEAYAFLDNFELLCLPAAGPVTYTVTYNGNGSTGGSVPVDSSAYNAGATATVLGNTGSLVRTGYTFTGWNTATNGTGISYAPAATFSISSPTTLYALWTINSYTITFDSAGGSAVTAITQNFGTTVTAPAAPTRSGYTFTGWSPALPSTMPANNQTVTAQWTSNTYMVTYAGNGSTGGSVPVDSSAYTAGATATVLGNTGNLVRTGYTFTGWNTAADGSGIGYSAGNTFAISTNVTLYAMWIGKASQAITFGALPAVNNGTTSFTLSATASSGLPVSYASSNTLVATVSGNTVTIVGSGSTTITASQAGDSNYNAAPDVTQVLTVTGLPLPWISTDIGTGTLAGSATFNAGTFTQDGSGIIGSTADKLRFTYQTLTGDGEIVARISSLQNTGNSSRVGVMIRDSLAANSKEIFMGMAFTKDYRWDRRTSTGGSTTSSKSSTGTVPNTWVRLVRSGTTITAYKSTNGTSWTTVGSTTGTTFANTCYIGLAVGSGSDTTLNTSQFSNLTVTP